MTEPKLIRCPMGEEEGARNRLWCNWRIVLQVSC